MKYFNAAGQKNCKKTPAIKIKLKKDSRSDDKIKKSLSLGKYVRLVTFNFVKHSFFFT